MAKNPAAPASDLPGALAAAERFMQAVKAGDEATARAMIIIREGETLDFKGMHGSTMAYQLGAPKTEGTFVVVEAKVEGPNAPPMPLPIMLVKDGSAWKVDMGASIKKMMGGVDLEAMMKEMATGLGNALGEGMKAVGEGLAEAMGGEKPQPARKKAAKPAAKKKSKR